MYRHLCRVGTGDEIRRAEQIKEFLVTEPLAAFHGLVMHKRDVGRRTAEGGNAQPQEQRGNFSQSLRQRPAPSPLFRRPHLPARSAARRELPLPPRATF